MTRSVAGAKETAGKESVPENQPAENSPDVKSWPLPSNQQQCRRLEQLLQCVQILCTDGAIDHTVIAGERERHGLADRELAVFHDAFRDRSADGDD